MSMATEYGISPSSFNTANVPSVSALEYAGFDMYDMKAPNGVGNMKKIVAGRQLWNYDNLEPAEKKLIL